MFLFTSSFSPPYNDPFTEAFLARFNIASNIVSASVLLNFLLKSLTSPCPGIRKNTLPLGLLKETLPSDLSSLVVATVITASLLSIPLSNNPAS